jgi:hypothetical protein
MIRFILFISVLTTLSFSNSEHYFIKLGSFKNLRGLEQSIARLPDHLRANVVIVRRNVWYIPFAYLDLNRRGLYRYVPQFKRYFPDAHINHSAHILNYPLVRDYRLYRKKRSQPHREPLVQHHVPHYQNVAISEDDYTPPLSSTVSSPAPILNTYTMQRSFTLPKKEKKDENSVSFNNQILSGKHYFLAYKSTKESPNLLIKVTFKIHTVSYQPIIGDMQMTKANYLVEDGRLYMFADSFTKDGAYSILEKSFKNYFLVSSWINGKKLNTLRYYFNLNEAKEYLNVEQSKGLANILEEGIYDDFFLDEDY